MTGNGGRRRADVRSMARDDPPGRQIRPGLARPVCGSSAGGFTSTGGSGKTDRWHCWRQASRYRGAARCDRRVSARGQEAAPYCPATVAGIRPRSLTVMPWSFAQALMSALRPGQVNNSDRHAGLHLRKEQACQPVKILTKITRISCRSMRLQPSADLLACMLSRKCRHADLGHAGGSSHFMWQAVRSVLRAAPVLSCTEPSDDIIM
jgi:hypothetical protein